MEIIARFGYRDSNHLKSNKKIDQFAIICSRDKLQGRIHWKTLLSIDAMQSKREQRSIYSSFSVSSLTLEKVLSTQFEVEIVGEQFESAKNSPV